MKLTLISLIHLFQFYSYFVRYITILYFLNDVEEGGQTAFPVADNETFNHEVCIIDRSYIHTNKILRPHGNALCSSHVLILYRGFV